MDNIINNNKEEDEEECFDAFSIKLPNEIGFTIYSKSGCKNCSLAKNLLINKKHNFFLINCDDYLIDYKNEFLNFMEKIINKPYKLFPMIFYDGKFLGGYKELEEFFIIINTFTNTDIENSGNQEVKPFSQNEINIIDNIITNLTFEENF